MKAWRYALIIFLAILVALGGGGGGPFGPSSGPREVLIVRESANDTPDLTGLLVELQTGPPSQLIEGKGHTLTILDEEDVTLNPPRADNSPAELIIKAQPDKVLARQPLPATAAEVLAILKAKGG